jgi:hypothetical protein
MAEPPHCRAPNGQIAGRADLKPSIAVMGGLCE